MNQDPNPPPQVSMPTSVWLKDDSFHGCHNMLSVWNTLYEGSTTDDRPVSILFPLSRVAYLRRGEGFFQAVLTPSGEFVNLPEGSFLKIKDAFERKAKTEIKL